VLPSNPPKPDPDHSMIIINADDWGRSVAETDAALECYRAGRITSVTAMMFMGDSERAAQLAEKHSVSVGLHLNLNQSFDGKVPSEEIANGHERIVKFMTAGKYTQLLYNPFLREQFRSDFQAQMDEFVRLYGKQPTHVDGHQHRHLCTNMILDHVIPKGLKVRRSFSFWPGEKSWLQRRYRAFLDAWVARRYCSTDFFFSLGQCLLHERLARVAELAGKANVELMTHPIATEEYRCLMSESFLDFLRGQRTGSYSTL
jgi:predicted glycoside hydrolase/deacetylase ChbG (UPF0249 family)